jgi:hypothetical protein
MNDVCDGKKEDLRMEKEEFSENKGFSFYFSVSKSL